MRNQITEFISSKISNNIPNVKLLLNRDLNKIIVAYACLLRVDKTKNIHKLKNIFHFLLF
jgi:hypothetical protein